MTAAEQAPGEPFHEAGVTDQAAWYRGIGDTYALYALNSTNPAAKIANAAEAARYYAIAQRMEGVAL